MSSFEQSFFDYQLPTSTTPPYSHEMIKNNDLRLLVEIATSSYLRMSTDPKTNTVHFTCKAKGPRCYDLEAYPSEQGYYFTTEPQEVEHSEGCELRNEMGRYLQIYNLMKLKKQLIEEKMRQLKLMDESPSVILTSLSSHPGEYFFEKHINQNVQLRRKLRKRFDNVVNIDIKKIGKGEQLPEKQKKKVRNYTPTRQKQKKECSAKEKTQTVKIPQSQDFFFEDSSDECIKLPSDEKTVQVVKRVGQAYRYSECSSQKYLENEQQLPKCQKAPKIKRLIRKKKQKNSQLRLKKRTSERNTRRIFDSRESILLLSESNERPSEMYVEAIKEDLPEIKALDEYAEMVWSSDSSSQSEAEPMEEVVPACEDYFKSLRNSALQRSLEKESLLTAFASMMGGECNKENHP